MKTQISNLISGRENVVIQSSNEKYNNANKSTSHSGFAGTKREERDEIARRVIEENHDGMNIEIKGVFLSLNRISSISGKTVYFENEITEEDYKKIVGRDFPSTGSQWSAIFLINGDMTVEIHLSKRKNENRSWRYNSTQKIGEEFVTIL